ncbi:MAG: DUF2786 domain-containing protein [Deltaproteobacteria bacterium]|nr:DUF2786 domain-containing protein [Deltaproteobacteria bacterium]
MKTVYKNAWLRQLYGYHQYIINTKFGLSSAQQKSLKPYILFFTDQTHWGYWKPKDNIIGLNLKLMANYPWDSVKGIFGHELTHQLVDFLAPASLAEEGPHGPTFKKYAQLMGLDPVFAVSSVDDSTLSAPPSSYGSRKEREPNPILSKVQKLLALASSPEPAEAEAALAAASRLMKKHNLKLAEEEFNEPQSGYERWMIPLNTSRFSAKFSIIGAILKTHFFVEVVVAYDYNHLANREEIGMVLIGRPINLAMADHVFHFLMERSETLWLKNKPLVRAMGEKGVAAKTAFINSLLSGFLSKLNANEKQIKQSEGLDFSAVILSRDAGLDAFTHQHYPNLKKHYSQTSSHSPFSQKAGAAEGQALTIYPPVANEKDSKEKPRKLLT